ncbi:NADH dehydrogenase subunit E [Buchnera aphidicola (Nipponaphis monzeni)]|uniref:NADH-quinone oxidoreductase subunit E n=1 Tax=Buchnera aphidicola (Nipponaphis monzeni) TaxID=2495405 RepID=A0A455TA26_9GAMM|nr:NADH-quinone oxidoreductase subunit NuoE [Buchnera aphidicola]BBI01140.1 NADH dehydrogenase subunit E [Buchnera aphidicola (Nipponaphis monzeni)]
MLTNKERMLIECKKKSYANSKAASIEALKIVQRRIGWVPKQAIIDISEILKVSISEIESIATFYNQIFRKPVGKNIIRYCDSVVCYVMGYEKIKKVLIDTLGITIGETTVDNQFTLLPVCCLGNCDKAPTIMINQNIYSNVSDVSIINLLESYK